MSPVIPEEGFVVISQVRPRIDQGNGPEEEQSYNALDSMPKSIAAFYRGEPEVLGTIQIFAGILFISIGILCIASMNMYYMGMVFIIRVPLWSGILFIISGSLSVAASVKPTAGKVTSSLVMNIFSSLTAACGIILAAIDVSIGPFITPISLWQSYCAYYKSNTQCLGAFTPFAVYSGIMLLFLLLFLLIFCIAISTSVFACKAVCRPAVHVVVVYQTTTLNIPDTTREVPPDSNTKT